MALTKTLAQLRTALLRRAGFDTATVSADLSSDVLNEIINDAVFEGWDVIVGKWLDYYTAIQDIAVDADADTFPLSDDFYKLRRVWLQDGARWIRLKPADLDAAHAFTGDTVSSNGQYRYRITNGNLVLMPVSGSALVVRVFYIPLKTEMVLDADTVTFEVPIEFKYVLAIAWRDILDRQNLDPSPAIAKMQTYEAKLRTAADSRDAGEPFYLDPYGPGYDEDDVL